MIHRQILWFSPPATDATNRVGRTRIQWVRKPRPYEPETSSGKRVRAKRFRRRSSVSCGTLMSKGCTLISLASRVFVARVEAAAASSLGRGQRSLLGLPVFNRVSAGSRGVASAVWAPPNPLPPICNRYYDEVCSEGG